MPEPIVGAMQPTPTGMPFPSWYDTRAAHPDPDVRSNRPRAGLVAWLAAALFAATTIVGIAAVHEQHVQTCVARAAARAQMRQQAELAALAGGGELVDRQKWAASVVDDEHAVDAC